MAKQLSLLTENFGQPKTFQNFNKVVRWITYLLFLIRMLQTFQFFSEYFTVIIHYFPTLLDLAFSSIYSFTVYLLLVQLHQTKVAKVTIYCDIHV